MAGASTLYDLVLMVPAGQMVPRRMIRRIKPVTSGNENL
jgi:hypothetical protein